MKHPALLGNYGRGCRMVKQEIQFAVVTKGNKVTAIGRSHVLQPEVKFRGGGIRWFDDAKLIRKGGRA